MLIKFKQLIIDNHGYRRDISFKNIFLNTNSIVSIADYDGASAFLISEGSEHAVEEFSLIKVSFGPRVEELIVAGSAISLSEKIDLVVPTERILHD